MEKIKPRWRFGIFIGVKRKSNEVMISTSEGIKNARSIRRRPFEKRWTRDSLDWVKWAPWHRYRDAEDEDGEVPEDVPAEERSEPKAGGLDGLC